MDTSKSNTFPYEWQDKKILWHNAYGYRIASGNRDNTFLTIWTEDNKKVGELHASVINKKHPKHGNIERRAKISMVNIDPKHRGQHLGSALYQTLLAHLANDVAGIYSYLPDRSNRKQVPRIYARLHGYIVDEDHAYIDRM